MTVADEWHAIREREAWQRFILAAFEQLQLNFAPFSGTSVDEDFVPLECKGIDVKLPDRVGLYAS